jgi:hypothetical protein
MTGEKDEGLAALTHELREIKDLLKDISRELSRIERRAEVVFPKAPKGTRSKTAPLDEEAARALVAHLTEKVGRGEDVDPTLRGYKVKPDLQAIASILGMTNAKLPPKAELVQRISTRLRQSSSVKHGGW